MNVTKTLIPGLAIIEPKLFKDDRGYFYESFNEKEFKEKVSNTTFVQDNESKSKYGVLRGLHFQKPPYAQAKLVRVVKGSVFDVAVDLREGSPTYGRWDGVILSEKNHKQFFIPKGFAHGFVALEDDTIFQYKCDNPYNKESEDAIAWNDIDINIQWGRMININDIILSEKDSENKFLKEFETPFIYDDEK